MSRVMMKNGKCDYVKRSELDRLIDAGIVVAVIRY